MSLTAALRHKRQWRLLGPGPGQLLQAFIQCLEKSLRVYGFHFHQLQLGSIFNENCSHLNFPNHSIKLIWVSTFLIQIISLPRETWCIILMVPDHGHSPLWVSGFQNISSKFKWRKQGTFPESFITEIMSVRWNLVNYVFLWSTTTGCYRSQC